MKAVILVGGEGTRLRPLTLQRLKSTVSMVNRPFLEYPLAWLKKHGIKQVIFSICHRPELVKKMFGLGHRYGLRFNYAVENQPLGTAGAIKNAEHWLDSTQTFVVLNGDQLTDLDLTRMLATHQKQQALVTMGLTWVEDPATYGSVQISQNGRILQFTEKAGREEHSSHWVNAGVYIFNQAALAYIPTRVPYSSERELFPNLLASGQKIWSFGNRNYWNDIGTPKRYLQSHFDILEGRMFMLPVGSAWKRHRSVRMGKHCRIHPGAELCGPMIMGDQCCVATGARVGELAILGSEVKVDAHARVERSVIWDQVHIGEGAQLLECIIASGSRIGQFAQVSPGTVLGQNAIIPDFCRI